MPSRILRRRGAPLPPPDLLYEPGPIPAPPPAGLPDDAVRRAILAEVLTPALFRRWLDLTVSRHAYCGTGSYLTEYLRYASPLADREEWELVAFDDVGERRGEVRMAIHVRRIVSVDLPPWVVRFVLCPWRRVLTPADALSWLNQTQRYRHVDQPVTVAEMEDWPSLLR